MKRKIGNTILLIFAISFALNILLTLVHALPIGPTATLYSNSTRSIATNITINESTGGGYIYTYLLNAVEQNKRWKAYVGNVSGTLTLDDANSNTIYSWDLGAVTGEVYATRNSSTISWTNVNCTWAATSVFNLSAVNDTNRTIENNENQAMLHTRLDNITATFSQKNHTSFSVGTKSFPANYCYSVRTYVNDTNQDTTDSILFPEIIMTDAVNMSQAGSILYVALIENDISGYILGNTYDFQILVPERGSDAWVSSTAYYFYVELT